MLHLLLAIIYLSFISLGLPDSLLGSAWPKMYTEFGVPVSYAGILSMIISAGTIISSLQSDRLTKKLGTGKVTAISVAMTALALFGFSTSHSYWQLCLWAIPYGLGAGSVDASLNNFVALHYASRHMSWLHCMWGIGASAGPYVMSYALTSHQSWNLGYRYIALLQVVLTAILFISLPLWKTKSESGASAGASGTSDKGASSQSRRPLQLREIIAIPGAPQTFITFFCYCALETTTSLWASSYLVLHNHLTAETAAGYAALFFLGITAGRAVSGFMTIKFSDTFMIRLGQIIIALGLAALFIPAGALTAKAGLVLIGLGCAPIYPCIIHSTPTLFGADKSQAVIGVQMACAYMGTCLMPPLFGLIASHITAALFPVFLLAVLVLMVFMHEQLQRKARPA